MPPLKFICPATGNEVDTGIDLDVQSFAALPRNITPFGCPIALIRTFLRTFKHGWANSNLNTSDTAPVPRRAGGHVCRLVRCVINEREPTEADARSGCV